MKNVFGSIKSLFLFLKVAGYVFMRPTMGAILIVKRVNNPRIFRIALYRKHVSDKWLMAKGEHVLSDANGPPEYKIVCDRFEWPFPNIDTLKQCPYCLVMLDSISGDLVKRKVESETKEWVKD